MNFRFCNNQSKQTPDDAREEQQYWSWKARRSIKRVVDSPFGSTREWKEIQFTNGDVAIESYDGRYTEVKIYRS